ncbi:hypothetical protein RJT34_09839 [Clitoria ternatea]|uniref:Uncharacterized protein n=1 Tax=Clitoria ternatea TaxID=43366 RepID=A0AAN9K7D0_CLITE
MALEFSTMNSKLYTVEKSLKKTLISFDIAKEVADMANKSIDLMKTQQKQKDDKIDGHYKLGDDEKWMLVDPTDVLTLKSLLDSKDDGQSDVDVLPLNVDAN